MIQEIQKTTDEELVKLTGETVIGTPSGLKAQHAQSELTRRLMKSIRSLDQTTVFYSKVLIGLTVGLAVLGIIQIYFFIK